MDVLKRVTKNTIEKRLLNSRGLPNFDLSFYALDKQGRYAGGSLYDAGSYAICTENGAESLKTEPLYAGKAKD